jgi:Flp pilus assembly protein TadG
MRARFRRIWRNESGAAAIEFAVVGSILIALCLAILQLGWTLQIQNQIAQAADSAIRSIIIEPETDDPSWEAQVYQILGEYDPERLQVQVGSATVDGTDFRTLTIDYEMPLSIPLFPEKLVTLSVARRTRIP